MKQLDIALLEQAFAGACRSEPPADRARWRVKESGGGC